MYLQVAGTGFKKNRDIHLREVMVLEESGWEKSLLVGWLAQEPIYVLTAAIL